MPLETSKRISLFRSRLKNRRFDEGTLRMLESFVVSKDVKSLLEIRAVLRELLRSESLSILKEIGEKSPDHKLSVVEFFVNAFAVVADVESCLALRYEALLLREAVYVNHQWLWVSYKEWLAFAVDSFDNGFYSIAIKGYENALQCMHPTSTKDPKPDSFCPLTEEVKRIKKQRDKARTLVASDSVQAQVAEYLNRKAKQKDNSDAYSSHSSCPASSMFRSGIKKRNMQLLHKSQSLLKDINCS